MNPGVPGLEGEQCALTLKAMTQPGDQLQFGSTVPAADKFVLLLSKQGRLIQQQIPVAVAPLKNLR